MTRHLIIGGARSGKSELARKFAESTGLGVSFIATAGAGDEEMSERILRHRTERSAAWKTIEQPLNLSSGLDEEARDGHCVVIDCLTLWLTNCLLVDGAEERGDLALSAMPYWESQRSAFLESLARAPGDVVLVSNEVGLGLVPVVPISRRFRDEQGRLNQAVAAACDGVTLAIAGLAWPLKAGPGALA